MLYTGDLAKDKEGFEKLYVNVLILSSKLSCFESPK